MWGKTRLLVFLVVSWDLAGYAKPPKTRKLAVVSMPGQGSETIKRDVYLDLVDQVLAHSGPGLAWRLVTYMPTGKKRQDQKLQKKLTGFFEKGKKAYRYLNFRAAKENFAKAVQLLRRMPYSGCDAKKIAQMYLYWARTVLDEGDDVAAQKILNQIFRFDPKAAPDPAVMPPNLVAVFDLAMNDFQTRPKGSIVLKVGPSAASIYVDCQLQSAGLVTLSGLVGDELWLHAQVTSNQLVNRLTLRQLPPRELTIFSPQPGDDRLLHKRKRAIATSKIRLLDLVGRSDEELDALATQLGVEAFVLYAWPKGQKHLSLALYVIHHGLFGQPVSIPLSPSMTPTTEQLQEAVTALADMLSGKRSQPEISLPVAAISPQVTPTQKNAQALAPRQSTSEGKKANTGPRQATISPSPPDPQQTAASQKSQAQQAAISGLEKAALQESVATSPHIAQAPWYNSWWFWTASSIVVAGAITTGLVLGLSSDAGPSGKVILTVNPP